MLLIRLATISISTSDQFFKKADQFYSEVFFLPQLYMNAIPRECAMENEIWQTMSHNNRTSAYHV